LDATDAVKTARAKIEEQVRALAVKMSEEREINSTWLKIALPGADDDPGACRLYCNKCPGDIGDEAHAGTSWQAVLADHLEENGDNHPKVVLEQQSLGFEKEDSAGCDIDGGNKPLGEAPSKAKQGGARRGTQRAGAGNSLAGGNSPPQKKAKTKAVGKRPPSGTGGKPNSLASFFGSSAK